MDEQETLFRKGVSTLILNDKNEFLLVNLESFETRFFAVPGGGIEPGETLEEGAYREIAEELGIGRESLESLGMSHEPVRFVFKTKKLDRDGVTYDGSERYFFAFRFIGKENEIKPKEGEVRSHRWVPFADLEKYLLFDNQLEETSAKISELLPFIQSGER